MVSENVEEYLEALYDLSLMEQPVRTGRIAQRMGVSPASVTGMLARLSEEGYLEHRKYHGAVLTEKGMGLASKISRRHKLLEAFLEDIIGIAPDAVHVEACRLEHGISDETEAMLRCFLGMNRHPDPNIDAKENGMPVNAVGNSDDGSHEISTANMEAFCPLSDLMEGERCRMKIILDLRLSRVVDMGSGLWPGREFRMVETSDRGYTLEMDGQRISMDRDVAGKIFVERVKE